MAFLLILLLSKIAITSLIYHVGRLPKSWFIFCNNSWSYCAHECEIFRYSSISSSYPHSLPFHKIFFYLWITVLKLVIEAMWNEHIGNENKNTLVNICTWLLVSSNLEEGRVGSNKVLNMYQVKHADITLLTSQKPLMFITASINNI